MTPTLPALRAFIEVARSHSFTRAADTLHLTQSAVSKQVQSLEEQLGLRLFVRSGKTLSMTPAGSAYLAHVSEALAQLEEGRAMAQSMAGEPTPEVNLEICASPAFAAHWLIPRLPNFRRMAPGTRLALRPRLPDAAPVTERFDLEIRLGSGRWPDARSTYLLGREMVMVASPELLSGRHVRGIQDLAGLPILQRAQRGYEWREWLAVTAPGGMPGAGQELLFEGFSVLIPAALAGLGLAICPLFMVLDALETGRLLRPLHECVHTRRAFYAVMPSGSGRNVARDHLLDWLIQEADTTQARLRHYLRASHSTVE